MELFLKNHFLLKVTNFWYILIYLCLLSCCFSFPCGIISRTALSVINKMPSFNVFFGGWRSSLFFRGIVISHLTLFRIGGGGGRGGALAKRFSPATSTNVGVNLQNFLTFSFKTFATLVEISRPFLVPVPNYWAWTKTTPQKKWFFWSNPYKIDVMITFLIEVLQLTNFGYMRIFTI